MPIGLETLRRQSRDKKLADAFHRYTQHSDMLEVYKNFADIQSKAWILPYTAAGDIQVLLQAAGFTDKQVKTAIQFFKSCNEDS